MIVVPSNRHVHSSCLASSINVCHVGAIMKSCWPWHHAYSAHISTLSENSFFFSNEVQMLILVAKRLWFSAIPHRSHKLMICPAPLDTPVLWSPAPNICGCPPFFSLLTTSQFSPVDLCRSPFLFLVVNMFPCMLNNVCLFASQVFSVFLFTFFPLFLLLIWLLLFCLFNLLSGFSSMLKENVVRF